MLSFFLLLDRSREAIGIEQKIYCSRVIRGLFRLLKILDCEDEVVRGSLLDSSGVS